MPRTLLPDLVLLVGVSTLLAAGSMVAHADLPLIAEPPDPAEASCGAAEMPPEELPRIGVDDLRAQLGAAGISIVDARSRAEYEAGHIPGAINLPAQEAAGILEVQSVPVGINDLVITYCDGGDTCYLSEYLGMLLRDEAQCKTVQVLDGGYTAWIAADAPVEGEQMTYVP